MDHRSNGRLPTGTRTVVITGGNTGLGYSAATAILRDPGGSPWRVVVACRDVGRAWDAVGRLTGITGVPGQVEALSLDLASLASVRAFADELAERTRTGAVPPVHAVVCNAGMQAGTTVTTTADGFESTFGVNHLGHFLLMNELMPQLRAPGRVVVVSSGVHDPANKSGVPAPAWNSPDALARGELGPASAADRPFVSGQRRYSTSKLANVYFTYGLARHLPHGVTANVFNPGLMPGTGLLREAVAPARFMVKHVLPRVMPLARLVLGSSVHSVEESGAALGRLVTDPQFAGVTGKYFSQTDEVRSSDESYDEARTEELWKWSLKLTVRSTS